MHKRPQPEISGKLPGLPPGMSVRAGRRSIFPAPWRHIAVAGGRRPEPSLIHADQGDDAVLNHAFEEKNIRWKTIDGIDHMSLTVLDVDEKGGLLHVLYKFAANRQIVLHRHLTLNKTMTIEGEHRLYDVSGRLKEIRPAGRFTIAPPSEEPHREGGGDRDALVLFVIYGEDALYQALDDEMKVVRTLGVPDFVGLFDGKRR
jgi:hypothetical protein